MLKLYQKRHPDINASAYTAYACLAVVIFFSVLGVVRTRTHTHTNVRRRFNKGKNTQRHDIRDALLTGVWERKHVLLDRFLSDPYSGHAPPQHAALLHGPMEAG